MLSAVCPTSAAFEPKPDFVPTLRAVEHAVAQRNALNLGRAISIPNNDTARTLARLLAEYRPVLQCDGVNSEVNEQKDDLYALSATCYVKTWVLGRRIQRGPIPILWKLKKDSTAIHGYRVVVHNLAELLLPLNAESHSRVIWAIMGAIAIIGMIALGALMLALQDSRLSQKGAWLAALLLLAPVSSVVYLFLRGRTPVKSRSFSNASHPPQI